MQENIIDTVSQLYIDDDIERKSRLKSGRYYTPFDVAYDMARYALSLHIDRIKSRRLSVRSVVTDIKFADISAGTGIFVMAWLLAVENALSGDKVSSPGEMETYLKSVAGNIVMTDIDGAALDHFKRFIDEHYPYMSGLIKQFNINPLSDKSLAYLKTEFGGFDVILGNPPYIGERGNLNVFKDLKRESIYKDYYQGKMDYLYFFFYRAYDLLKADGIVGFLSSGYFITADGAANLRFFLKTNASIIKIVGYRERQLFKSAPGHHSLEVFFKKRIPSSDNLVHIVEKGTEDVDFYKAQGTLFGDNDTISLINSTESRILQKIYSGCTSPLGDSFHVNQGLVSGLDYDKATGSGVFVLTKSEAKKLGIEKHLLKPFYKNSDIRHGSISVYTDKFILYTNGRFKDEDDFKKNAPASHQHLSKWKVKLSQRRETEKGIRAWYELHWPREEAVFSEPSIVCPHRARENYFALNSGNFYASADVYFIRRKSSMHIHDDLIESLCSLLNSELYFYILRKTGKMKGNTLELYATPLKNLKIPPLEDFSKYMFDNIDKKSPDELIFSYFDVSGEECGIISRELSLF